MPSLGENDDKSLPPTRQTTAACLLADGSSSVSNLGSFGSVGSVDVELKSISTANRTDKTQSGQQSEKIHSDQQSEHQSGSSESAVNSSHSTADSAGDSAGRIPRGGKEEMHLLHTSNLRNHAGVGITSESRNSLLGHRSQSMSRGTFEQSSVESKETHRTTQSSPVFEPYNTSPSMTAAKTHHQESNLTVRNIEIIEENVQVVTQQGGSSGSESATSSVQAVSYLRSAGFPETLHSATSMGSLVESAGPPVSFARLTMNMVLCGLGAGILSLPWTTAGAGIMNAAFWNALVLGLSYYTMMMMVNSAERYQVFDMEALLLRCNFYMSGKRWKATCSASIWLTYWIALVGYLIIIADSITHIMTPKFPDFSRKIPVIVGSLIILPLCFLSQRTLAVTSGLGVFSNCFVVFAIVYNYYSQETSATQVCMLGFTEGNITYVSAVCMAMVIQPCILPMYETMEDRSPRRFSQVLMVSFFTLWVLFTGFSLFAYMSYGADTKGNVLNNLPPSAWYSIVARACMAVVGLGVYPLMVFPMLAPLRVQNKYKRYITAGIVLSSAVGALKITDLGHLNVMCGALSTFFFIAMFPVIIGMCLLENASRKVLLALFIVGTLSTILGLYFSDNGADALANNCAWPIEMKATTDVVTDDILLES